MTLPDAAAVLQVADAAAAIPTAAAALPIAVKAITSTFANAALPEAGAFSISDAAHLIAVVTLAVAAPAL